MSAIDISTLSETAIKYRKDLQMLPYAVLFERLALLGINLVPGIQNKDVITNHLRKQGIARPYSKEKDVVYSDVGKTEERTLEVFLAVASVKDNIQDYKKVIVGPDELLGKNKSKQHPWQLVMLQSIVRTFGEDILDALFPAVRDVDDQTPMGLFNGFDTLIDNEIAAGKISAALGNLVATDDILMPTAENDYTAYQVLQEFYLAADPMLRNTDTLLKVPYNVADAYDAAFFNKFRYAPKEDAYNRTILHGSNGKCLIVRSPEMGNGQRIELTTPGNHDFGMDTQGDENFIQVRDIFEDPNYVQFWIQASYGTRIRNLHKKRYQINDGLAGSVRRSGDYS